MFRNRGEERDSTIHGIRHGGSLWELILDFILAYRERTQILQQQSVELGLIGSRLENVHAAVFELQQFNRKVEGFMSTQEERLRAVQSQLTSVADGINTLQQQLADLKTNNPELDDEISSIEQTVKAIGEDLNPPTPAPAPEG